MSTEKTLRTASLAGVCTLIFCLYATSLSAQQPSSASAATSKPPVTAAPRVPIAAVEKIFALTRPAFDKQRAYATVAYMDQYFRVAGNTGFNGTIHRVEDILKGAGYVEESAAKPGARLTYRIEHRPLRGDTWEPIDAVLTIEGESTPLEAFKTNRNMLPINSISTPAGGVTAEVVNVGKGSAAEMDKLDVKGKIVFAESGDRQLMANAASHGALGVLAYRPLPKFNREDLHPNVIQFSSTTANATVWEVFLSKTARDRLSNALQKGSVRLHADVQTRIYPSEELTVVADVHGSVKPDERYVVSAHIQEPGANDNATGVATLSEMARVIGNLVTSKEIDPKRTITMLFGEEIKQTSDYLAKDSARARGVKWGLSLDMVGEDTNKTGGTFLIEKMPDPSAIWTRGEDHHTEWGGRTLTKDALKPHYYNDYLLSRCLDQAAATGWVVRTNPFEGGSDHTPFLTANKPGALFWHFTDVYYHTDGDRLEMVSPQTMANVGNAALAAVLTMTTAADGPTTRALIAEVERAADARINTEVGLSKAALAAGGDAAKETDVITTWVDYYVKALDTMQDIEIGGSSPETMKKIQTAQQQVRQLQTKWDKR